MSIAISYNTRNHLQEMQDEDAGEEIYYRWTPGEWFRESFAADEFEKLNKELYSLHLDLAGEKFSPEEEFLNYRDALFDTAVEALSELKEEKLFAEFDQEFILLFSVSDYENKEKEIDWVKQLNAEKLAKQFEDWLTADKHNDLYPEMMR